MLFCLSAMLSLLAVGFATCRREPSPATRSLLPSSSVWGCGRPAKATGLKGKVRAKDNVWMTCLCLSAAH